MKTRIPRSLAVIFLALALVACGGESSSSSPGKSGHSAAETGRADGEIETGLYFSDVTAALGLNHVHCNGADGARYMPETMGSGAALADFNQDGRLDVYIVEQNYLVPEKHDPTITNRLYLQDPDGRFRDVTQGSGVGDDKIGMGCAVADYDGDGDQDIYVVNAGANRLYRNDGDAHFVDVTAEAGVGGNSWSVSSIFLDYDRDGDLDLFVVEYVDWSLKKNKDCFVGKTLVYCSPQSYDPLPNVLYRNEGNGRFVDVSTECGIAAHLGKGLGVSIADADGDGWIDIYVANDRTPNFLFRNVEGKRFEEVALESGTAYSESGLAEAGMGTDFSDINGDGLPDILVTNFDKELNNSFINTGDLIFEEKARENGMGGVSLPYVGFGLRAFDIDLDGDEDVYVANGHITDNIQEVEPASTFAQPDFLFINDGEGKFDEVLIETQSVPKRVGRGVAVGDIDNDGDPDLLVTNNGEAPLLLRNDQVSGHHWIGFRLVAKGLNRDGLGAELKIRAGDQSTAYLHRQRGTYLSAHDQRIVIGLGKVAAVDSVSVTWPDGSKQDFGALGTARYWVLQQGVQEAISDR